MTDNNLYILNKAWNTLQKLEGIITALEYVGINIDGSNNNSHAGLNDIYNAITDQYDIILNIFNIKSDTKNSETATSVISDYLSTYPDPIAFPDTLLTALSELSDPKPKTTELWAVFESQHAQDMLEFEDRGKFYDYDCMRVYENEQDAIKYRNENLENREIKLIRF